MEVKITIKERAHPKGPAVSITHGLFLGWALESGEETLSLRGISVDVRLSDVGDLFEGGSVDPYIVQIATGC